MGVTCVEGKLNLALSSRYKTKYVKRSILLANTHEAYLSICLIYLFILFIHSFIGSLLVYLFTLLPFLFFHHQAQKKERSTNVQKRIQASFSKLTMYVSLLTAL